MPYNPSGYTLVPNELFDTWLPFLSLYELKVILAAIRIEELDVDLISKKTNLNLKDVKDSIKFLINRQILEIGEVNERAPI